MDQRIERDFKVKQLGDEVSKTKEKFNREKQRLTAIISLEIKVQQAIVNRYEQEYEIQKKYLAQIKNVLRVPRLYHEYQSLKEKIVNDKQLELYLKS